MSTELETRTRLVDLSKEERADIAQTVFIENAKGISRRKLSEKYGLTDHAVKTLIHEYGAYMAKTRSHTKEAGIVVYDYVIEKGIEVMESPEGHPALVRAKAVESVIQAQTRKDKLLGHESPNLNINATGQTLSDIVTRMYGAGGEAEDVSPMDSGMVGEEEEIMEAEVIEDDTDEDSRIS